MIRELYDSLQGFARDPALSVLIITGAGDKAFSAGANLQEMAESIDNPRDPADNYWFKLTRNLDIMKPMIAAVNGYCLGGGLELAMACDIRIAAEHARFGLPEITRGLIPGGGGTQRLPRMLAWCHAAEVLLLGEHIDAGEAYRIGLVNRVVPAAEVMPLARRLADKMCAAAPMALIAAKEAMVRGADLALAEGLALEEEMGEKVYLSEDFKEGRRAFVEGRKPVWRGR